MNKMQSIIIFLQPITVMKVDEMIIPNLLELLKILTVPLLKITIAKRIA